MHEPTHTTTTPDPDREAKRERRKARYASADMAIGLYTNLFFFKEILSRHALDTEPLDTNRDAKAILEEEHWPNRTLLIDAVESCLRYRLARDMAERFKALKPEQPDQLELWEQLAHAVADAFEAHTETRSQDAYLDKWNHLLNPSFADQLKAD